MMEPGGRQWRFVGFLEPPKQISHFDADMIRSFDLSRDGKQLVIERDTMVGDVYLIQDVR